MDYCGLIEVLLLESPCLPNLSSSVCIALLILVGDRQFNSFVYRYDIIVSAGWQLAPTSIVHYRF